MFDSGSMTRSIYTPVHRAAASGGSVNDRAYVEKQLQGIAPTAPTAASLGKYGDIPVNLSTGQVPIEIPLFEIASGGLHVPITLRYHSGGVKVREEASWVGLMVADGISGLDAVVGKVFPGTPLQRCVIHLKRNMLARVRQDDKAGLADYLRDVFRTGQRGYTVEQAWAAWQRMCDRWGKDYRSIRMMRDNAGYKACMTYLNYAFEIQSMIYATNRIERLNRDFRRVTRMRTAMPNEESVLTLMGSVAMDHKAFERVLPRIRSDKSLFPDHKERHS